ncbi:hypothetical protein VTK56DRAFT_8963 [Thermocarpiscus australiensis]
MTEDETMDCPFCGWQSRAGEQEMLLHMETLHAEGDSPFVVHQDKEDNTFDSNGAAEDVQYAECPVEGCGELLLLQEIDYHLELHAEESGDHLQETSAPAPEQTVPPAPSPSGTSSAHRETVGHRRSDDGTETSSRQAKAILAWKRLLRMPGSSSTRRGSPSRRHHDEKGTTVGALPTRTQRLGKSQLGKHAHEERMPDWLISMLRRDGQVVSKGVIPVLAQLLEQSPSTKYAYLCHPCVQHVSKLRREGGFCGYRNIQMLSSYIIHTKFRGHQNLGNTIPSIFQIQDFIETAWDAGINPQGRIETGGIRGTRKYIGTPEALAMFRLLDIPCDAQGIKHKEPGKSEALLMEYVENYFQSGVADPTQDIRRTSLPPVYLQHAGHSLTIIGFERLKNGTKNLIVFDPVFHDSSSIMRLVGQTFVHPMPDLALKPYRRGNKYLKNHREFEILSLLPDQGTVEAALM